MNARTPSFGNSQSIEGNRHVNRQLQYYGKEVTKICMGVRSDRQSTFDHTCRKAGML